MTSKDMAYLALWALASLILEAIAFAYAPILHVAPVLLAMGMFGIRARESKREIDELHMKTLHQKRQEVKAWYFESIITYSANIIFTVDSDNRILKFNRGSERTFGISQADAVGREVHDIFDDPTALSALLAQVESDGSAENPGIRIKHADSEAEVWLQTNVSRMLRGENEIIGTVFNCVDITKRRQLELELQEKNQQLLRLSITDGLTGLFNVRHFHEELSRSLKGLRRYPDRVLSVALLDVDQFKRFNDTKGHQAGDQLLTRLGKILQKEIRQGLDQAFRYGGDEFVLLLPDTRPDGARIICERVQASFAKEGFEPTNLSIGIAGAGGNEPGDDYAVPNDTDAFKNSLVKRADVAMYTAKNHGGGITLSP
jgi:diguanylate cyclase (GGDEF)-like protein/PAS domain S-box-containing protein